MRTNSTNSGGCDVDYLVPVDDRPRYMDWTAGTDADQAIATMRWWLPAHLDNYGGRDTLVVIDSKGEMAVFHGKDQVGSAAAPYSPHQPHGDEFWPLVSLSAPSLGPLIEDPAVYSHRLRDTGWMMCRVDDELGLAASIQSDDQASMSWRLAHAFVLLGFYPPLGIEFTGAADEFGHGAAVVGERPARRVKRALIERLHHDRRELRGLSDRIESNWRL
jgi:hypothetical protein